MKTIPKEIADRCTFYRTPNSPPLEPVRITNIEPDKVTVCGDCGDNVNDARTYSYLQTPFWHWREKCMACKRYRHPITGEMLEVTGVELNRNICNKESVEAYAAKKNVLGRVKDK